MTNSISTPIDLANIVSRKLRRAKLSSPLPRLDILNKLFEFLFYTSLKTEEGQFIKVTISLINPDNPDPYPPVRIVADRWNIVHFNSNIPFTVKNLIKLSKAADPWSSSLAVYFDLKGELYIWGMIDQAVHYQSFLNYEVDEGPEQPGLFQTSITGIGALAVIIDYELIATLKQNILISNYIDVFRLGPISKVLIENGNSIKQKIHDYLNKRFPDEDYNDWADFSQIKINQTLSRILLRIQNYEHGGALLITDKIGSDLDIKYKLSYSRLNKSITNLIKHTIGNSYFSNSIHENYLENDEEMLSTALYLDEAVSEFQKRETKDELKGAIRFVASLAGVDGLVVLTKEMRVKGFGAVIKVGEIPEIIYSTKTARYLTHNLSPISTNHFGTRHRSMFSYCWNNAKSLGFVVSQDGDIRAIKRIKDKLILWENIKVQQFIRSKKIKRIITKKRIK